MTEVLRNQYAPDEVSPPGETLVEVLQSRGMTQADLAERTGRPTKTINEIVKGKAALTPETALQFELVLGIPASFWNNRESAYREYLARTKESKRFESQTEWLDRIPVRQMVEYGWIPRVQDPAELVERLFRFFGVASASSWDDVWESPAYFRQSKAFHVQTGAVAAWLRKGELEAQRIECKAFDASRFRQVLVSIRKLTRDLPPNFAQILAAECSSVGVCVVFVRELPKTRVWGATRWLSSTCVLIQLSLRYKHDDHLWFTFFHEAGHALLHGKRDVFIDADDQRINQKEAEADEFARDWLIPPREYKMFKRRGATSCAAIERFAFEIGVAAGIVVGRLQHDGVLPRTHCNDLKREIVWAEEEE